MFFQGLMSFLIIFGLLYGAWRLYIKPQFFDEELIEDDPNVTRKALEKSVQALENKRESLGHLVRTIDTKNKLKIVDEELETAVKELKEHDEKNK